MQINGVEIEDTFAEAFGMWGARLIVTGEDMEWARTAAEAATGLATSIIGCGCEAGTNDLAAGEQTPDGRPGMAALLFATTRKDMEAQLLQRVGQAVMTCVTSACYNGLDVDEKLKVGGKLRYFGDGFQRSKLLRRPSSVARSRDGRRVRRRGELRRGQGRRRRQLLHDGGEPGGGARRGARRRWPPCAPCRAPSCRFRAASCAAAARSPRATRVRTSRATRRSARRCTDWKTALSETGENAVLEIVVDGLDEAAVAEAMRVGIVAACRPGVTRISAGNYGGSLGQFHFALRELVSA